MSFIRFIAVLAVSFVIVSVDGGAQPQFYPQQNPFINYYRPAAANRPNNYMMNKFNRQRRPVLNNSPIAISGNSAQEQAKIFFGVTNFFTSTTTTTSTFTYTYTCTVYTATACGKKRSIVDDDDGDTSQIGVLTLQELEEAKKKREAEPEFMLGPMYRGYDGKGYNFDDVQSTLGNPYIPNNRDAELPFYFNPSYSVPALPEIEEPFEEDLGRLFWFWITTTFTTYTTTTFKSSSTPSCSTTSSYGQC